MRLRRQRRAGPAAAEPRADPPPTLAFPSFRYHPDPRGTGSVVEADTYCKACGWIRGHVYAGPVHADAAEDLHDAICPWCIADGTAAQRFDAEFADVWNVPSGIARPVADEIARRTPGYTSWQDARWLYHCGDGAAFLGLAGRRELDAHPDALEDLRREHTGLGWSAEQVEAYLDTLDSDGEPTAYLFRCLGCGRHLAYSDFT